MSSDKQRIVVAGESYGSVEEMPPEVRRVYELAVEARNLEHKAAQVKLVFNGQEYDSLEAMPADVRKLYQNQQLAMETYRDFSVDATTPRGNKGTKAAHGAVTAASRSSFLRQNKWAILGVALLIAVLVVIILV